MRNLSLSYLDLFGMRPNLSWMGKNKSYSGCGLLVSFVAITLVCLLFGFFSKNMIQHTNPIYTQTTLTGASEGDRFLLTDDVIEFSFGVTNLATNSFYINPSIYTIIATLNYVDASGVSNIALLDLEVCSQNPNDYNYNQYCIKDQQSSVSNIYLMSGFKSYIFFQFFRCQNSTANNNSCASPDAINSLLSISACSTYYTVWSIDPENYGTPMQRIVKNNWTPISLVFAKAMVLNLISVVFNSDNGWIITSDHTRNVLIPLDPYFDLNELTANAPFFKAILQMSGDNMVYRRHYDKLQDVAAKVSGMIGTIMIILGILTIPYSRTKMFEPLVNSIFDIRLQGDIQKAGHGKMESLTIYNMANNPVNSRKIVPDKMNGETSFNIQEQNSTMVLQEPRTSDYTSTRGRIQDFRHNQGSPLPGPIQTEAISIVDASDLAVINQRSSTVYNTKIRPNSLYQRSPLLSAPFQSLRIQNKERSSPNRQLNGYSPDLYLEENDTTISPMKLGDEINLSQVNLQPEPLHKKYTALSLFPSHYNSAQQPKLDIEIDQMDHKPPPSLNIEFNSQSPQKIEPSQIHLHNKGGKFWRNWSNRVSTNYFQWIKSFVSPQIQISMLDMGMETINKNIDVLSILKRFREIDNLKLCLLSERQRVLFDNIPKPQIVINTQLNSKAKDFITINGWSESYEGNEKMLTNVYQELKSTAYTKSSIDDQLLLLYERNNHKLDKKST